MVNDMATASSRAETSHNHRRTSQLHAIGESKCSHPEDHLLGLSFSVIFSFFSPPLVSCAKLKRKKSVFGAAIYVEVTAEGETRRTAKSHSSSNPKWDESLTL